MCVKATRTNHCSSGENRRSRFRYTSAIVSHNCRRIRLVDPLVSVFVVRDLDSELFEREVHAVDEWLLNTSYAFHMMRDHSEHQIPMLGGMWGLATNRLSTADRLTIVTALLPSENEKEIRDFVQQYSGRGDQDFLTDFIWPLARRNSIAHDSYSCVWSRYIYRAETRPFPTRREHPTCFVGCPKPCCTLESKATTDLSQYRQCPPSCRPTEHRDWLFC